MSVTLWGHHLLAPTLRFHTHGAAEKSVLGTGPDCSSHHRCDGAPWRTVREPNQHMSTPTWHRLHVPHILGQQIKKKQTKQDQIYFQNTSGVPQFFMLCFHSVHLQRLGCSFTGAALPARRIIHRVNKNGFGWIWHTVSCLKPNRQGCRLHRFWPRIFTDQTVSAQNTQQPGDT